MLFIMLPIGSELPVFGFDDEEEFPPNGSLFFVLIIGSSLSHPPNGSLFYVLLLPPRLSESPNALPNGSGSAAFFGC